MVLGFGRRKGTSIISISKEGIIPRTTPEGQRRKARFEKRLKFEEGKGEREKRRKKKLKKALGAGTFQLKDISAPKEKFQSIDKFKKRKLKGFF